MFEVVLLMVLPPVAVGCAAVAVILLRERATRPVGEPRPAVRVWVTPPQQPAMVAPRPSRVTMPLTFRTHRPPPRLQDSWS